MIPLRPIATRQRHDPRGASHRRGQSKLDSFVPRGCCIIRAPGLVPMPRALSADAMISASDRDLYDVPPTPDDLASIEPGFYTRPDGACTAWWIARRFAGIIATDGQLKTRRVRPCYL